MFGVWAALQPFPRDVVTPRDFRTRSHDGTEVSVLALLAFLLTPIAAVLVLVISLRRAWALQVVTLLWLVLLVSAAVVLPALDATFAQFMILRGTSQSVP